ncbi:MAG: RNA polymerase sigma-70 factor [Bacteroidota bacterium]
MPLSVSEFEDLFRSSHRSMCLVAYRIVNDRNFAEDIVQDVFLRLWKNRDEINIETSYKNYLHKATANASLNLLENNKRLLRYKLEAVHTSVTEENTSKTISLKELELYIQKALHRLPPKCRTIFVLSRYEGLRYKQIAECLGISVKTVESQMGKALEIMRGELKPFLTREFLITAISVGISALLHFSSILLIMALLRSSL